jgi:hypothetical protein
MSDPRSALRRLLSILAGTLLIVGALATGASADPYGELTHFGEKGTGLGQFNEAEPDLGVDPTENSVYAVDTLPGSPKKPTFRLQKFSEVSGKYQAVASIEFKPVQEHTEEGDEIEGVAVDPKLKRVYVLADKPRSVGPADEEPAAAYLFAFSTEQEGKSLKFATGTGITEGVLVNEATFKTASSGIGRKVGEAPLIEPSGITVDPTTDELIVTATQDFTAKELKSGHHEFDPESETSTTVLQRINSEGVLGSKWVDETGTEGFFEECECVNSPVVSKTGSVYVLGERDQVFEIPSSFDGKEAPTPVFEFECESEVGCPEELLTEFPGFEPSEGAQMSIGAEGHLYIRARITNELEGDQQFGGALVLKPGAGPNPGEKAFTEVGWTGGQSPASASGKCIIDDEPEPALAAGASETVFMLERSATSAKIIKYGPNGGGCPTATASTPSAKAGGVEVEPFGQGETVTMSSTLKQANALSTVWEFTNAVSKATTSTETKRQQQITEVQHVFSESGEFTVTEKIHTDNLDTPLIEKTRKVKIVGAPTVVTEEAKVEGVQATLNGTVNPNGQEVTKCEFEYGETPAYGSKASCSALPGKGEAPKAVSAVIAGLKTNTTYHFRLLATSAKGTGEGTDKTLKTTAQLPLLGTPSASGATETGVTVSDTVNPKGLEVEKCEFEYGTTTAYSLGKAACSPASIGDGSSPVAVSANITGLSPGTGYHFTLVAKNVNGSAQAIDAQFKTLSKPIELPPEETPTVTTQQPPPPPPPPGSGVLPHQEIKPTPIATLAANSAMVSSSGAFTLKVKCPSGETTCSGTVTLRTLSAVVASTGHEAKAKAAILTLATGSFSAAGGQVKTITLHLSSKARALLAHSHSHSIASRATILAHDPAGASHTTLANVTLHAAKPKHH